MKQTSSVKVTQSTLTLPTYLPAAPDKNPMFLENRVYQSSGGKVYPLPFTDRIAEKRVDRKFNWPQHHRPATFLPVDVEIEEHADGSKTIWCSDHDQLCRMKGMHGVCLHPGRGGVRSGFRAVDRVFPAHLHVSHAERQTGIGGGLLALASPNLSSSNSNYPKPRARHWSNWKKLVD